MVFSVKANKNKIIAIMILLAIIIVGAIVVPKMMNNDKNEYVGSTVGERVEFLNSFGWQVSTPEIVNREVTIPQEFSEVYEKYNKMQKTQGFDLEPFKGMTCTQYIYTVENYSDSDKNVQATLLVYEGKIIGGDISCAEMDGFMHGFARDSKSYDEM